MGGEKVNLSSMEFFVSINGEQRGPFSLESLHQMKQLGSVPTDTLVWSKDRNAWSALDEFLTLHPFRVAPTRRAAKTPRPSRIRGFAAAFAIAIVGGGLIAGLAAVTGALFGILWLLLGWATGAVARAAARTSDQCIGLFAFFATLLGICISFIGLEYVKKPVLMGFLITFPVSLWLAFRTGSTRP